MKTMHEIVERSTLSIFDSDDIEINDRVVN